VRRAELHLRVGEALERADGRSGRNLADLAHHFAAAAPLGGARRGVEYNRLAAEAATDALAFDEAAARLRTALDLSIEDPVERAEVFLALGNVSQRAGKGREALDAFRATADIARELGDGALLARAAIGFEDACWGPGIADQGAAELLEEAAAALGDESSDLRVGLLSGLARALDYQGDHERGAIVRTSAVAMARRIQVGARSDRSTMDGEVANRTRHVHWHVVPRYETVPERYFAGKRFHDDRHGMIFRTKKRGKIGNRARAAIVAEILAHLPPANGRL